MTRPHDKATVDLTMKLPLGYTCASVGKLINTTVIGDTAIFEWSSRDPMPTYLVSANASIFYTYSDWYKNKNNEDIEIKYYVWNDDYNNLIQGYNPREAFKYTADMVKFFSNLFFDYPYQKYGMVAVYPYNYGGMEASDTYNN